MKRIIIPLSIFSLFSLGLEYGVCFPYYGPWLSLLIPLGSLVGAAIAAGIISLLWRL